MTTDDEASETAKARVVQVERLLEERDRLIHDLEVHQAELEAQNQQLREAQYLLEDSRARYSDLYDLAKGGITFAQDASAEVDGMPLSAQATGCVDFVLPPDKISGELQKIGKQFGK